jgi:hypothetical protein
MVPTIEHAPGQVAHSQVMGPLPQGLARQVGVSTPLTGFSRHKLPVGQGLGSAPAHVTGAQALMVNSKLPAGWQTATVRPAPAQSS